MFMQHNAMNLNESEDNGPIIAIRSEIFIFILNDQIEVISM